MDMIEKVKSFLACPNCRGILDFQKTNLYCANCKKVFSLSNDGSYICFVEVTTHDSKDPASNIRDYFKRWPGVYYFIVKVFSPIWWSGMNQKKFLELFWKEDGVCLNLGSGPEVVNPDVINVDSYPYTGVSIVADIHALPVRDSSAGAVLCNTVLEHVTDPKKVVAEIHRVLRPGASVYITMPLLYPFHSSPMDFTRLTHEGLRDLMSDFEVIKLGVRAGPFSLLATWLCYLFASLFSFGSSSVYWVLVNLFMFIFFPIKVLDIVASRLPFAQNSASILYVVARKK